jgi:uncharacterized iron-regulated protein
VSAHTPGPWHSYGQNVHKDRAGDVCRPIKQLIAFTEAVDVGEEQAEANARFIAASPKVAEKAEQLIRHLSTIPTCYYDKVRAAVNELQAALDLANSKPQRKAVRA